MFSFFKRSKSKDDSDKKDKSKDKSSNSPFNKRNDNPTKVGNSSKQTVPVVESISQFKPCDFSFPVGSSVVKANEAVTPNTTQNHTESTNTKCNGLSEHNNNTFGDKSDTVTLKENNDKINKMPYLSREEFYSSFKIPENETVSGNSKPSDNLFSFPTDSVNCDTKEKCKSEEEESPAEAEVVFKTAPNTPVLAKHLPLSVSKDSIFIDANNFGESLDREDIIEKETSEVQNETNIFDSPLGLNLDLPNADSDSDEDTASTVLENPEVKEITVEKESEIDDTTTASKLERTRSTESPLYPGELYDITEESTSEDEEAEDSDSAPVMSFPPTIEERLPQDISK